MGKRAGMQAKANRYGYFFVLPFVIVFLIFNFWPTIYTFLLSFGNLEGLKVNFDFVGLANYKRLLSDKYFWGAVGNTFIIWGLNFLPQLGLALLFAIWLTDVKLHIRGKNLFRALFYLPNPVFSLPEAALEKRCNLSGVYEKVRLGKAKIQL